MVATSTIASATSAGLPNAEAGSWEKSVIRSTRSCLSATRGSDLRKPVRRVGPEPTTRRPVVACPPGAVVGSGAVQKWCAYLLIIPGTRSNLVGMRHAVFLLGVVYRALRLRTVRR
jgi:hypothetical protein